jgi:serine/threonine protein kinase
MQPPLPIGTVLQNRYRLIEILGQGGFGRTYLAEDQGRFNERCALKEFIPAQMGAYPLEKSKELFQREAAILYQIQHPQIPQFRATIEQDGRLFLVQDYVEGKNYRTLLAERKLRGQKFAESEVLQLLQQMLPVLDHIHGKGIIHRDISPENIMLRDRDRLPVLIDFGVVKELANKAQFPQSAIPATTVGKMGYAPSEQIQTGRAYPSSDLYALAVTCIVLLTGQEPQDLYDETTLTWSWYRWIPAVDRGFTQVLNRMLSYKPGDRYQDAREVAIALKTLYHNPTAFPKTAPQEASAPPNSKYSQMQTVAVGRPQASNQSQYPANQPNPAIPSPVEKSSWDNPLVVTFVGMCLAVLAGVGSWALVSAVLNRQLPEQSLSTPTPAPTVFDSPTDITPTPTPIETPTPTPTVEPVISKERLNLLLGNNLSTPGNLKANETIHYILTAQQGQRLNASLQEEGVLMTVLGPTGQPIDEGASRVRTWEGVFPAQGDYTIELSLVRGVQESKFNLDLLLTNPVPVPTPTITPTPTPTITPTPTPEPTLGASPSPSDEFNIAPPPINEVDEDVLDLPPGNAKAQISGQTSQRITKRYRVYAQAGQVLSVRIQTGGATLDVRYPNGELVENASGLGEWEGKVYRSGEYQVDVKAAEATDFTLDVSVKE